MSRTCCCSTNRRTSSTCGRRFCWSTFCDTIKEACLIVSHDRAFLAATCTHTLDLSRGKLTMYPGKIDAFLENQQEQREHDERTNATVLAKTPAPGRIHRQEQGPGQHGHAGPLEEQQLEKLETIEIAGDEPTAVHPRSAGRAAQRARPCAASDLAIGYPEREIARGIDLEIDHGSRAAVVGDNGQGKTTLSADARRLAQAARRRSPLGLRLPDRRLRPARLHQPAGTADGDGVPGITSRPRHEDAGDSRPGGAPSCSAATTSKKPISVLSGGERARLCLAGLLLAQYNVLVLDEPGNHLDVDTVEALAEALLAYKGTVIFTSHDRHFMKRVATCDRRGPRRPRRQLSRQLRGLSLRGQQGDRRRGARARKPDVSKPPAAAAKSPRIRSRADRSETIGRPARN